MKNLSSQNDFLRLRDTGTKGASGVHCGIPLVELQDELFGKRGSGQYAFLYFAHKFVWIFLLLIRDYRFAIAAVLRGLWGDLRSIARGAEYFELRDPVDPSKILGGKTFLRRSCTLRSRIFDRSEPLKKCLGKFHTFWFSLLETASLDVLHRGYAAQGM